MADDSDFFNVNTFMKYACIPASAILIILVVLQRRSRPNPCGFYAPGLVVPLRFLDGYEERWSYALAFGSITGILISMFTQLAFDDDEELNVTGSFFCSSSQESTNGTVVSDSLCDTVWVKTLLLHVQALVTSLVCAPQFVCITTSYKLVGALMGFGYSVFWVVFYIVGAVRTEMYQDTTTGTLLLLRDLPVILCFLGLCVRSVWAVYRCYVTRRVRVQRVDNVVEQHQVDHVTALLRPQPTEEATPEGVVDKVKVKVKAQIFPHFKLPTRIICLAFVQMIVVYYMGLTFVALGVTFERLLKSSLPAISDNRTGDAILGIYKGVYVTSEAITLLSSVVYIALFVINYRINMINIYKGKKQMYLINNDIPSSKHVASSLRLPGYQIAYTLWGLVIIFVMFFVVFFFITFAIYILAKKDMLVPALESVAESLSVPISTILIFYLQVLLVRKFLLQPKLNEKDEHHPLNVDNRHVYEVVAYTLVFSNLLVGLASALFRSAKSLLLGLVFLARLDRCLLMEGFESLDPGYMAYVGSLLVDNAHNNPVMRTFCGLLVRLQCSAEAKTDRGIALLPEPKTRGTNSRASRRWHLAYTLLNNPDLLPRRKLALLLARANDHNDNDVDDSDMDDDDSSARGGEKVNVGAKVTKECNQDESDVSLQSVVQMDC